MDRYQAVLTFLRHEHADVEPVKTRQVADALGISAYSARYRLLHLQKQRLVLRDRERRGSASRWSLVSDQQES
ncbi:FaeA/PapI family transcriptional regulator [Aeromonas sp. MdU4]|uniref:FaeA/PapI family transcriptional regulator n=1 Tax=Aeromonas sp. MdU4 TaxID=3342819 RepID=UPI0035BAAD7B